MLQTSPLFDQTWWRYFIWDRRKKLVGPAKSSNLKKICVNIKNKQFHAVYDSGSTVSLINQKILDDLYIKFFKNKNLLKTISGESFSSERAFIKFKINNIEKRIRFYVIKNDNFKFQLLLGLDAIREFHLIKTDKF